MKYTLNSVLTEHIGRGDDYLYVVNPDRVLQTKLYQHLSEGDDIQNMRILADKDDLKQPLGDFKVATQIAALVERGDCKIRTLEEYDRTPLIGSSSGVSFWTQTEEGTFATFQSTDSETTAVIESLTNEWETADEYSIRTPGLSRLRETMREELGEEFQRDFDMLLAEFDELRGTGDGFDEVSLAILAAARNELVAYNLTHWGEDVGLASKATFSRSKQALEEADLIETSKVRIELGRPRQRLHLKNPDAEVTSLVQRFK